MGYKSHGSILAGGVAVFLAACSSGGGDDPQVPPPPPPPAANVSPTANAGTAQTVTTGSTVTLNGSLSSDPDGSVASYAWTQTAGTPTVVLANATTSQPTFPAPTVAASTTLTFSLTVTDNLGAVSAPSTVSITVNPPAAG